MREENMLASLEIYQMLIQHFEEQVGSNLKVIKEFHSSKLGNMHIEVYSPIINHIDFIQDRINQLYINSDRHSIDTLLSQIDKHLNKCSLVCMVSCNGRKTLLTSDIGLDYWDTLIPKEKLKANILKAPHHGDRAHLSKDYLKSIDPTYIVICADDEYTYELPSTDTHQFIESVLPHSKVRYTAENRERPDKIHKGIRLEIDACGTVCEKQL
ncbi:ComEC/Rec2 family competence protein [Vallitalea okinawensis]|uniref:hypothetical protein n=1 Tax=Vallitalea okinawensis TaxID=2078660 RepID=UPI001FA8F946|nr:hypothetical protein [Vallitalea okinawensis]